MKVEIRDDVVVIDGYVNAVERESKVLTDHWGQKFIEKIKAGTFARALDRAKALQTPVKVLLNHDYSRELTSTSDLTTELKEDNIGLRAHVEIRDAEVVEKAKNKRLVGWSFGFHILRQKVDDEDIQHRDVQELELKEVSILDDTKIPAYDGTSIEMRDTDTVLYEVRSTDGLEYVERSTEEAAEVVDNHEYENRYLATFI
ncbi:MAG: HK97 family phage prohead protease [Clostridiales bacterium]|jgi:hypothetical protein|nr:HK97 family phage prohead protease [Clostridiales bacterium]MBQ1574265.1 HK97 family phage prohead protease [Clostridiales bacterium]